MSRGARFRKAGGMVMFNEESDAKCVKKSVYNNPLDMWRNNAMEFPYLARVARHVLPIPATQAQSERHVSGCRAHCEQKAWSTRPGERRITVFPVQLDDCRRMAALGRTNCLA